MGAMTPLPKLSPLLRTPPGGPSGLARLGVEPNPPGRGTCPDQPDGIRMVPQKGPFRWAPGPRENPSIPSHGPVSRTIRMVSREDPRHELPSLAPGWVGPSWIRSEVHLEMVSRVAQRRVSNTPMDMGFRWATPETIPGGVFSIPMSFIPRSRGPG